jgi:hypothetical protein
VGVGEGGVPRREEPDVEAERVVGAALELDDAARPARGLRPRDLDPPDGVRPSAVEGRERAGAPISPSSTTQEKTNATVIASEMRVIIPGLHGPPVGRVSLMMVTGRVASMFARAMSIMPVVAHVSTSCWRGSVLAPRLPCHQKSLQAE